MSARLAVPILALAALVMIGGLSFARAQERPEEGPQGDEAEEEQQQPSPIRPFPTPGNNPALKRRLEAQRNQQQQPPTKGVVTGQRQRPEDAPPPETVTPGADQFQTGIDFRRVPPGARVTFNLEDADLPDLIRLISSITGKRFILPGKTRSIKATIYAPTKVTAAEAYRAFLSVLEMNGMTVVPSGRYLKIVETAGIEGQPLQFTTGASPGDDRFLTRMHRLENISSEDAAQLLARFKSPNGQVSAYAPTNTVIITDMGSNIRRMMRVIEAVDVPRTGEQVWIEPVHYADATELANRLTEIFPVGTPSSGAPVQGQEARARPRPPRPGQPAQAASVGTGTTTVGSRSGESRVTKILPDERTNSLIILATERAYLRILELIRALDVPLEGEGGIHVHYVQHGDAEELASTLSNIVGSGSGGTPGRGGRGAAGNAAAAAAAAGGAGGGPTFEGEIRITAHKPANALVITSSLHDYAALRRVIDRLDQRRRQVFIEAVIMEMTVDRTRSIGLGFHGGAPDFPGEGDGLLFGSNPSQSLFFPANAVSVTGLAVGVRGEEIPESQQLFGVSVPSFGVALTALASSDNVNVLSTPHLIALDNEEAEISVGQNVPLQSSAVPGLGNLGGGLGSLAGLAGGAQGESGAGLGALAGLASGFGGSAPRAEVGTTLRVTPHINDSDEIRLEIQQEISEAGAVSQGNLGAISLNKRTAKTQVVVRDNQTVVVGGLMRDRISQGETKIPILGDIPLLGALFRSTTNQTQKVNLLLFLTPYIIRDQADLRAIFERKMRERQEFIDRYFVFGDHEYNVPIDYTRTRGLLAEIVNELDELHEERRLIEEALARPPPEHVPRAAIGQSPIEPGGPSEGDVVITPDDGSDDIQPGGEEIGDAVEVEVNVPSPDEPPPEE